MRPIHYKTNEGLANKTLATLQTHQMLNASASGKHQSPLMVPEIQVESNMHTASDKRIIELETQLVLLNNIVNTLRSSNQPHGEKDVNIPSDDKLRDLRELKVSLNGFKSNIKLIRAVIVSCSCDYKSSLEYCRKNLCESIQSSIARKPEIAVPSMSRSSKREIHSQIDTLRLLVSDLHRRFFTRLAEEVRKISSVSDPRIARLEDQLRTEISLRRKLHNQLIELRGSIRVFARIRPFLTEEIFRGSKSCVKEIIEDSTVILTSSNDRQFSLDKVFGPNTTNSELFSDLSQLIVSSLDGYNVSIIAYGATNSGKTYTMNSIYERIGIELFDAQRQRYPWKYTLSVSVCEIYMDTVNDLLDLKNMNVDVRINPQNGFLHVPGLSRKSFTSPEQFTETLKSASRHRAVSSTNCNEHSSRSHLVTQIHLEIVTPNGRLIESSIHLVDLAGSERLGKSGASGVAAKEAQFINKSLSAFADVVHARFNKSTHVPYRNSLLTSVLNESLGGESKTLVIVQLNPSQVRLLRSFLSSAFRIHSTRIVIP